MVKTLLMTTNQPLYRTPGWETIGRRAVAGSDQRTEVIDLRTDPTMLGIDAVIRRSAVPKPPRPVRRLSWATALTIVLAVELVALAALLVTL